jgi:polysaccharide deacetylase family protein (PEP-CTERM system associated)
MTVENILTIDLEDWFHICGLEEMIPETSWSNLESRRNVKATFFVLGFVAEGHPELIREIENAGHEVATHGYAHRQVYSITPRLFREDLKKAVRAISAVTSKPVTGYRAPEWSIRDDSLWGLDILQEEGFEYDSSMAPLPIIGNPSYSKIPHKLNLAQGPLWEFPPLVTATPLVNLPLGGGWGLRVFPYPMIRSAIRKLNKRGQSALIYLHPREFDADCPRLRLPLAKRFVLHARLERAEQRLHRLLDDFRFTSVSDVLRRLKKRPAKA